MPNNILLNLRPSYELVTRYGAVWMKQILNATRIPTIDLYGPEATKNNFFSTLETQDPLVVNIIGHGNYNLIACQDHEVLLEGGVNTDVLSGRIVFDLSCQAGRDLGSAAVDEGCLSFLGYDEDFWVGFTRGNHTDGGMLDPSNDERSRGFFESHNSAPITYLQGGEIINSYWVSQSTFNYWIGVWEEIDSQLTALLLWNKEHQVMKPTKGEQPDPMPPHWDGTLINGGLITPGVNPLLFFVPLLIIPLIKKFK